MENPAATSLYNDLVTKDLEPEIKDANANPVDNPAEAEMFVFNWKTENKNYGTVVILFGANKDFTVFFGDNLGRTMEQDDKKAWYNFLEQMKHFAMGNNFKNFSADNISRLKYTMKGMAAIKEGLFEGYYGKKNVSYSDQPKQVRLMIKHNRNILEGEPRHRAIESLFVETADGERFKVPSRSLAHGRMIARHVAEGGNPYDAFGNHINEIVTEIATLSRFIRAAKHKPFTGEAAKLIEAAVRHYSDLKAKAKHMISQRGYHEARESFDPAEINDSSKMAESIRNMFIEQTLDSRIEEALPILAKLKETPMREADEFECWTNRVMEGTWALPNDAETEQQLKDLMSKPLIVGTDATNATEQLYDLVGDDILFDRLGDLADENPDANCWEDPGVINRLGELGIDITPTTSATDDEENLDIDINKHGIDPEGDYEQDVTEGSDRVDTLVTNGLKIMRGPTWLDAVAAIKYQVGERDYRERREFYDFFVQQLVDRYGKNPVAEGHDASPVASALTRRIMTQRLDLLKKYGPVKVTQAIDDAAEFFGDVEEIGSSDMYAYMQYVEKALDGMNEQGLAEGHGSFYAEQLAEKVFAQMPNLQNQDDIIKAGYDMAKKEPNLGTSVNGIFRDEDFVSDFVTNYGYLQKQGMAEDLDTDGVMMTKPSNMSSESADPVLRLKQMLKY